MKIIRISAGLAVYVGGVIRDLSGNDLSGAAFSVSLGTREAPGPTWFAPDLSLAGSTASSREVKLLVSDTTPVGITPGEYYAWIKVEDLPEKDAVRVPELIKVI